MHVNLWHCRWQILYKIETNGTPGPNIKDFDAPHQSAITSKLFQRIIIAPVN
jgi:hypothetical protein